MENDEIVISEINLGWYVCVPVIYMIAIVGWTCIFFAEIVGGKDVLWPIVLLLILAGVEAYRINQGLIKKITVSRELIIVDYFIFKKEWCIDYAEISSNRNLSGSSGKQGQVVSYRKQEIELNDGSQLTFTDLKFKNYDDLKNAIYRNMVAATQAAL